MRNHLHYFSSVPQASAALKFLASFPGNGGAKSFTIGKCKVSGAPSVCLAKGAKPEMSRAELRGALRAWSRLTR